MIQNGATQTFTDPSSGDVTSVACNNGQTTVTLPPVTVSSKSNIPGPYAPSSITSTNGNTYITYNNNYYGSSGANGKTTTSDPNAPKATPAPPTCYDKQSGAVVTATGTTCPSTAQTTQPTLGDMAKNTQDANQLIVNADKQTVKDDQNTISADNKALAKAQSTFDTACANGASSDPGTPCAVATQNLADAHTKIDVTDKSAYADLAGDKDNLKKNKQELKDAKKAAKVAAREEAMATKDDAKGEDGSKGQCGKYGGFDCYVSATANSFAPVVDMMANMAGKNAVATAGMNQTTALTTQGASATQNSVYAAQAAVARTAAKADYKAGTIDTVMAAAQGALGVMHIASTRKVNATAAGLTTDKIKQTKAYQDELASLDNAQKTTNRNAYLDANDTTTRADLRAASAVTSDQEAINQATAITHVQANIKSNKDLEVVAQQKMALVQTLAMASTAATAHKHNMDAAAANAIANMSATAATATAFSFNPNSGLASAANPDNNPNVDNTTTPLADNAPTTTTTDGNMGALPNNTLTGGPTPAPNVAVAAAPGSQGGGGAGLGGGNTSASKDDNKPAAEAAAKSQVGGQYAAGDGAGVKYSHGGGGAAGVGVSDGFADMLKKMLGGDDPKKDLVQNKIDLDGRSPASDSAAVLGRDKDIFKAIHNRYQTKNSQGAI